MKRKYLALVLAGVMALSMTACGGESTPSEAPADGGAADDGADAGSEEAAPAASGDAVTIQIGLRTPSRSPSDRRWRNGSSWWTKRETAA